VKESKYNQGAGIPFPPSLGQSRITTNAGSSDIEEKSEETFCYGKQQKKSKVK